MNIFRACLISLAITSPSALAQGQTDFSNPCESEAATAFNFWVGDWVAFDFDTGVVQGIDRIDLINNGCTLYQEWSQMTDRYRAQDAPYKYAGISFSYRQVDGSWQQTWVGNGGGPITLTGGLTEEGIMQLETGEFQTQNGQTVKRIWRWAPKPDGTIHSWGEFLTRQEDDTWSDPQIVWNLTYVPRADAPDLVARPPTE